ncbi:BPL-N domain-containing protein [Megalodesulfovibrio paquesii]
MPGGVARRKALALGETGMAAIRQYIHEGGSYVGFCGGSGLGLTGEYGLALCPWTRAAIGDRLLHLVSGHIHVHLQDRQHRNGLVPATLPDTPLAPIWWPARFAPTPSQEVEILATYGTPGPDFWIADLPLSHLPMETFGEWEQAYGISLRPDFLAGQPCIIHGRAGRGRYLLSYAHLETPSSPQANAWLAHVLEEFGGLKPSRHDVPAWNLELEPVQWEHPLLLRTRLLLDECLALGREHMLLFPRNEWLLGWRAGLPGSHLNHLNALTRHCLAGAPNNGALQILEDNHDAYLHNLEAFVRELHGYLLAERLAMTLARTVPGMVSQKALKARREAIFGTSMEPGGSFAPLLAVLDEVACHLTPTTAT